MMALIEGLRLKVTHDLSVLGANVFQATKWPVGFGRHDWRKHARRPNLTDEDRRAILTSCPSVLTASSEIWEEGQRLATATARTQPNVMLIGTTPEWVATSGVTVASGRFFSEADVVDHRAVVVIGVDVVDALFAGSDPLGQQVRLRGRPFEVIGVLARRGSFLGLVSLDNQALVPLTTFGTLYGARRSVDISVQALEPGLLVRAEDEVVNVLRRRRGLEPGEANDFEVFTNDSMTRTFKSLSAVVTAAAFGVCILSLLVGGIGILNIMLVAVAERTKEIGVRRALGARRRRILAQFATEAVALALIGGLLGILAGFAVAFLVRWTIGFNVVVPVWAVLLSLVMSTGVGLVFGIYPAVRAARLDPVEAMRTE